MYRITSQICLNRLKDLETLLQNKVLHTTAIFGVMDFYSKCLKYFISSLIKSLIQLLLLTISSGCITSCVTSQLWYMRLYGTDGARSDTLKSSEAAPSCTLHGTLSSTLLILSSIREVADNAISLLTTHFLSLQWP